MRISDWSSDVCSSDLRAGARSGTAPCPSTMRRRQPSAGAGPRPPPPARGRPAHGCPDGAPAGRRSRPSGWWPTARRAGRFRRAPPPRNRRWRSEEHTSELQSLMRISYAVFCFKKKKIKTKTQNTNIKTNKIITKNQQTRTKRENKTNKTYHNNQLIFTQVQTKQTTQNTYKIH